MLHTLVHFIEHVVCSNRPLLCTVSRWQRTRVPPAPPSSDGLRSTERLQRRSPRSFPPPHELLLPRAGPRTPWTWPSRPTRRWSSSLREKLGLDAAAHLPCVPAPSPTSPAVARGDGHAVDVQPLLTCELPPVIRAFAPPPPRPYAEQRCAHGRCRRKPRSRASGHAPGCPRCAPPSCQRTTSAAGLLARAPSTTPPRQGASPAGACTSPAAGARLQPRGSPGAVSYHHLLQQYVQPRVTPNQLFRPCSDPLRSSSALPERTERREQRRTPRALRS